MALRSPVFTLHQGLLAPGLGHSSHLLLGVMEYRNGSRRGISYFGFFFFFFCVLVWFVSVPGVLHVEAYALSASCILPCLGIREGRKFNRLSALNGLPLLPD